MIYKKIGNFKRYLQKPNNICSGALYIYQLEYDSPFGKTNKTIRVYVPKTYNHDSNKRFPVLYMFDGQNIVDEYTTAFGEWNIDEEMLKLIKNKKHEGVIIVGIDSSEIDNPSTHFSKRKGNYLENPHANIFLDFIINKVKPLIDDTFLTLKDKDNTGIGGSSMGGLASFYAAIKHKDVFGFTLSFSPAFLLFDPKKLKEELKKIDFTDVGKIYMYLGGSGFEKQFIRTTTIVYKYLSKHMDSSSYRYIFDSFGIHHESAWQRYFADALLYLKN